MAAFSTPNGGDRRRPDGGRAHGGAGINLALIFARQSDARPATAYPLTNLIPGCASGGVARVSLVGMGASYAELLEPGAQSAMPTRVGRRAR
jgi:hypothetical protein